MGRLEKVKKIWYQINIFFLEKILIFKYDELWIITHVYCDKAGIIMPHTGHHYVGDQAASGLVISKNEWVSKDSY